MRRVITSLAGVALVGALGACGTQQPDQGAPPPKPPETTKATKATNVVELAQMVGEKKSQAKAANFDMTIGVGPMKMQGQGALRAEGPNSDMRMSMDVPTQTGQMATVEEVLTDGVMYMKLPGQQAAPGKPWVKMDMRAAMQAQQSMGTGMPDSEQITNPLQQLKQYGDAARIDNTKQDKVNGVDTTHYTVTVDTVKAAQSVQDPKLKAQAEQAAKAMPTMAYDVWLDKQNQMSKIRMDMPMPQLPPEAANSPEGKQLQGMKMEMTMNFKDWGKPVQITAPPQEQVAEMPTK